MGDARARPAVGTRRTGPQIVLPISEGALLAVLPAPERLQLAIVPLPNIEAAAQVAAEAAAAIIGPVYRALPE